LDGGKAREFAERWAERWGARDLDAILEHYAEDVVFTSPLAVRYAGRPVIEGRKELERYWRSALEAIREIRFRVDQALWDSAQRTLVVTYDAGLDGKKRRGCEVMCFRCDGLIERGEALYGADVV
jgi:ketosteroid isomerase-like protein